MRSGGNEGGRVMAGRFFAALKNDVRAIRMTCVRARCEPGGLWKTSMGLGWEFWVGVG